MTYKVDRKNEEEDDNPKMKCKVLLHLINLFFNPLLFFESHAVQTKRDISQNSAFASRVIKKKSESQREEMKFY